MKQQQAGHIVGFLVLSMVLPAWKTLRQKFDGTFHYCFALL